VRPPRKNHPDQDNSERYQHPILTWSVENSKMPYKPVAHRSPKTRGYNEALTPGNSARAGPLGKCCEGFYLCDTGLCIQENYVA